MSDLPTLYRIWNIETMGHPPSTPGKLDEGWWLVPVERCEHGLIDEHDSLVPKIDERGRKFDAVEWCDGSPTLGR